MMKKIIVALVVVAAVSGLVYATYGNTNSNNITNNSTTQGTQKMQQIKNTTPNTTPNTTASDTKSKTVQTKISSAEAMKIANSYIQVSTAKAGTPALITQDNKLVYIVPVIDNGTNVGEIDIDAQTGANLGGAGGSPK
jgi:uncharacterized membrane protein YkoI